MKRILNVNEAVKLSKKFKREDKKIILTGGCFDVLHLGHIKFLGAAKKIDGILFVFTESDETVKKIKGKNRPINNQDERAKVLSAIRFVDYVIKTPPFKINNDYDRFITRINPNFIAVTKGSESIKHAQRQAKLVGAKVIQVIGRIPDESTSKIAKIIVKENAL